LVEAHATDILNRIWARRSFYKKAYSDRSQNAIGLYIYDSFVSLEESAVKQHLNQYMPAVLKESYGIKD
jgi:hypothetical protein